MAKEKTKTPAAKEAEPEEEALAEKRDPLEGKTVVVMVQSMAGERLSYIPGDQVAVRDDVALAWEEAGIARFQTGEDPIIPDERVQIHPEA